MSKWKRLDLKRKADMPPQDTLVVLRMIPKRPQQFNMNEKYDAGMFKKDPYAGRKLWLHHSCGISDPTRLNAHYDIWWCMMPEFDGV